MSEESGTPRVDAVTFRYHAREMDVVDVEDAKKLERDLAAVTAELRDARRSAHAALVELQVENDALRAENERLREALLKLSNEVSGILSAFQLEMRVAVGNTNFSVLSLRRDEARAALEAAPQERAEWAQGMAAGAVLGIY